MMTYFAYRLFDRSCLDLMTFKLNCHQSLLNARRANYAISDLKISDLKVTTRKTYVF